MHLIKSYSYTQNYHLSLSLWASWDFLSYKIYKATDASTNAYHKIY